MKCKDKGEFDKNVSVRRLDAGMCWLGFVFVQWALYGQKLPESVQRPDS